MDDIQEKLNSIMSDPNMMAQIMSMAQAFGQSPQETPQAEQVETEPVLGLDIGMLQKVASFAGKTGIDRDQQTLLKALRPYMSAARISKLEKAMRSAKIAALVTSLLGKDIL